MYIVVWKIEISFLWLELLTFGLGHTVLEPTPFESGLSDSGCSYRLLNPTERTVIVGLRNFSPRSVSRAIDPSPLAIATTLPHANES